MQEGTNIMIWLRRAFTLPLILIFIVLIVAAVTVTAVNNTAADPNFYNNLMSDADMYNYVYDSILPAALDETDTAGTADLPVDIDNLHDEIVAAGKQSFAPSWLQQQFESVTKILIPYMVDDEPEFTYTFTVKDRMDDVGQAIKDNILAGSALLSIYDDLLSYIAGYYYENLPATPPDIDITRNEIEIALRNSLTPAWLKTQLGTAVDQVIPYLSGDRNYFDVSIPVQQQVTDETLLTLLGPGNEDYLDEAQVWLGEGWAYTQNDLYADLSAEAVQDLQDVRGWIHDGYIFDQNDLRDKMSENSQDVQSFDDVRHWISVGRSLIWVLWLVPFLLLIGIGFLGGRGWKTRAAGPLVILFFVSLVMFLGVMLTWTQWGEAEMHHVIDSSGHQGGKAVMLEKADEVAVDAAGSFVNDMQDMYMYMMIASGVGLAGVGGWWMVSSRGRKSVARST
jgi:hypothetical protein